MTFFDYTTKKHPVEAGHGGISRCWLVQQLPAAKYPNVLLELALHPYYPCTFASFAEVTEDVLVDFFLGEDSLTFSELLGLSRGLNNYKRVSVDYLVGNALEICRDELQIQQAKRTLQRFTGNHPALILIRQQMDEPEIPQAVINNIERFLAQWEQDQKADMRKPPRSTKLPEEEEEE